jgi:hypothetical protein
MGFDVSHRDDNGFLKGSFDQGWLSYPIEVVEDIKPFLFPCQQCKLIVFHVAAEQHAGLGIKLPFTSKPLVSTGRGYHALCNDCTMINSQLTEEMVQKLRRKVLPSQICNLFLQISKPDLPAPYSAAFIEQWVQGTTADRPDLRKYVGSILKCYALETDKDALRQSFCWACAERIVPDKKANGFFARTFSEKPAFSYICAKCGKEVLAPAVG